MAWIVEDRLKAYQPTRQEPYLTVKIKDEVSQKYFPRYPNKRAALLPLFHIIMHEYGYIAPQAIDEAAAFLELTPSQVQDAVSFYEEFRMEKTGRYVVNVCRSIACELCGYQQVVEKIREVFGIEPGETTDDGQITLLEVECLGACEQAPCALVNEDLHGQIKPAEFCGQLQQLRATPGHAKANDLQRE